MDSGSRRAPSVLVVDWLGQGGIAQVTDTTVAALRGLGCPVTWITRGGGEFDGDIAVPLGASKVLTHRRIARAAAKAIADGRPDVVIVQGHILPPLESSLYDAVRDASARLVVVVHDGTPHSPVEATRLGLRRQLLRADVVICLSRFVADDVEKLTGRTDVLVVPHPVSRMAMAAHDAPAPRADPPVAVHFGVLKRQYKGTATVAEIARQGLPPWQFELLGVGAPRVAAHVTSAARFLPGRELAQRVSRATAALLPYRRATQSGAVALAQAVGTVPVASAVGGIPEQIQDGVTGLLVAPEASPHAWIAALQKLSDADYARALGRRAAATAQQRHVEFVRLLTAHVIGSR